MGFGNMTDLVKELVKGVNNCNFIISCGKNKKLLEKLEIEYKNNKHLQELPFTRKLNLYIKAADVVLTKPGGLTTTEIATIGKPFIHTMPIPGCENYNANFFKSRKMSIKCDIIEEVVKNTKELLNDENLQKEMIKNQRKYINRNASYDIADLVIRKMGD